jgi:hypothetical protein
MPKAEDAFGAATGFKAGPYGVNHFRQASIRGHIEGVDPDFALEKIVEFLGRVRRSVGREVALATKGIVNWQYVVPTCLSQGPSTSTYTPSLVEIASVFIQNVSYDWWSWNPVSQAGVVQILLAVEGGKPRRHAVLRSHCRGVPACSVEKRKSKKPFMGSVSNEG